MNQFKNPLDPENIQIKKVLTQWLTQKLHLDDSYDIDITEISCSEPSCVHAETLFSITHSLSEIPPQYFKITKPLVYIRKWDIDAIKISNTPLKSHKH